MPVAGELISCKHQVHRNITTQCYGCSIGVTPNEEQFRTLSGPSGPLIFYPLESFIPRNRATAERSPVPLAVCRPPARPLAAVQAVKLTETLCSVLSAAISGFYSLVEAHRYLVSVPLFSGRPQGLPVFLAALEYPDGHFPPRSAQQRSRTVAWPVRCSVQRTQCDSSYLPRIQGGSYLPPCI